MRQLWITLAAGALLGALALAQDDAPPLGDVARQARAQKQLKEAPRDFSKDPSKPTAKPEAAVSTAGPKDTSQSKASHVITNEELPEHSEPAVRAGKKADVDESDVSDTPLDRGSLAEQWKEQIREQKSSMADLQRQIDDLNKSIQYAPANCVENCRQWNEQQQRKQQQADSMKTQLEGLQQHLEEMQENARKQGFGGNIYDP
jgi:hypothetical protein